MHEAIRSARSRALLATCRWILAVGTDEKAEACKNMDCADHELSAAGKLYERANRGLATGHELLGLL